MTSVSKATFISLALWLVVGSRDGNCGFDRESISNAIQIRCVEDAWISTWISMLALKELAEKRRAFGDV